MSTMPNIKVTVEASSSPDGSAKTGRSTLSALSENRDGLRSSASGPAAFEMFEKFLAAPPAAHLLHAVSPVDGSRSRPVDGEGFGGRKRLSSDSEVIRMARELPEVGKRWARDIASSAARVVQVRTNFSKDSAVSAASKISKNLSEGHSAIEMESSLNSKQETTAPCSASNITLVLTNFEEDTVIAGDETEAVNLYRASDSEQQAMESFEKLPSTFTNWDKHEQEIISDAAQTYKPLLRDNSAKDIKITHTSGIWGANDVNEDRHLFINCVDDSTAVSGRTHDFCARLDKDDTAKESTIAEHHHSDSNHSVGTSQCSLSLNGGSSVGSS